jgi:ribosome maturation factor RimP
MRLSPLEERVSQIIAPVIQEMGFDLVHVIMTSEANEAILRIMAEHAITKELNIDDCAKLSRAIGTILDVEDVVSGAYRLEMSSPGIDRPLVRATDFIEYIGFDAKVEIEPSLPTGQKRFRGILAKLENNILTLETDEGDFELPLANMAKARLVITDKLLAHGQEKRRLRIERLAAEEKSLQTTTEQTLND